MAVQIFVNFTANPVRNYVTWAPARCAILSNDNFEQTVTLRNGDTTSGGQLVFLSAPGATPSDTLEVTVPASTNPNNIAEFFVAGRLDETTGQGFPSTNDGDASIEGVDTTSGDSLVVQPLMVRIRKDANTLTAGERDRFLSALVMLNQRGDFADFQNMHTSDTSLEIHQRSCFLPWHRFYLLDLERKLQSIDPSVALPYWRFDEPAPNVFVEDFAGVPDATGLVEFSNTNPLVNWQLTVFGEGSGRVRRTFADKPDGTRFDPTIEGALIANDEMGTINLGNNPMDPTDIRFEFFERMEGDPHGSAHVSFRGQISNIGRAPADPLFFMLHGNVDRLWAKWQWMRDRYDSTQVESYHKQGIGPFDRDPARATEDNVGNFLDDSLWPWNGLVGDPRPRTAPGTYYPSSPFLETPVGQYPLLRSSIDYQGQVDPSQDLGFSYDDVPFDF